MMRKSASAGVASSVVVLVAALVLVIVVVGVPYLSSLRNTDEVGRVSDSVTHEVSRVATKVREASGDLVTTAKVKTAFAISKSVRAFDIDVDSREATVVLTGAVPSTEVEAAALQIARDTSGVVDVVDRLEVDATVDAALRDEALMNRLTDAEIKALVYERLLRADNLDGEDVAVVVVDRVVTLTGTVPTALEKDNVGAVAGSVPEVESVINDLRVADAFPRTTAVPAPDEYVATAVRERLQEGGAVTIDGIEVNVRSGVVQLRGSVRSRAEKQLAEMLAGSVEGVVEVVNDLDVS